MPGALPVMVTSMLLEIPSIPSNMDLDVQEGFERVVTMKPASRQYSQMNHYLKIAAKPVR